MIEKIKDYLVKIEKEKNIQILWACETGSRAWGFPSTDSDFDIRLIYVHKSNWYLNLIEQKDSIDLMFENNDIDISGWELKKSLNLLRKSNAPLLERIQSPIIYKRDKEFISELLSITQPYYSKIATMHHYLSMGKKFVDELENSSEYKLKRFFYTLRSAMVCKWIIEKKEIPPIEFKHIYDTLAIDKLLRNRIVDLIELKKTVGESYLHNGETELIEFIKSCLNEADKVKETLPTSNGNIENLNSVLRKYILKYDN